MVATYVLLCFGGLLLCVGSNVASEAEDGNSTQVSEGMNQLEAEAELSKLIKEWLEHLKQEDPRGMPGINLADPMPIPDQKKSISLGVLEFKNSSVIGLSKFKVQHVYTDLVEMQVTVYLYLETVLITGKYNMRTILSRSKGNYNVTMIDLNAVGHVQLEVNEDGHLEAQEFVLDMSFEDIQVEFEDIGMLGGMVQTLVNTLGSLLFDSIKGIIMIEVNQSMRGELNQKLLLVPKRFPNNITPLDMGVAEGRRWVRDQGWDPLRLPSRAFEYAGIRLEVTKAWVTGASTFHRVGNATITIEDNIMSAGIHVGTKRLEGFCHWRFTALGLLSRRGRARFALDSLQVRVVVSQPLNVEKKAVLEELDIELGNIQVRMDGAGTLDFVVEYVVNVLPNLLRFQIVDALEEPLKVKIQEVLDNLDLEKVIDDMLLQFENSNKTTTTVSPELAVVSTTVSEMMETVQETELDTGVEPAAETTPA